MVSVTLYRPSQVLVAIVGKTPQRLAMNQVMSSVTSHPLAILPTRATAAKVLGSTTQGVGISTDEVPGDKVPTPIRLRESLR